MSVKYPTVEILRKEHGMNEKTMRALICMGAFAIGATANAASVHTTTATSGKLSEVAWNPALPSNIANVELVFSGANFAIENDVDGLAVNKLTFKSAGTLSGKTITLNADGANLPVVSSSGAIANTVSAPFVVNAKTTFKADHQNARLTFSGAFSGAGQAVIDIAHSAQVSFNGDSSSWSGGVDVFKGLLNVASGASLGSGSVYVTNKWVSGNTRYFVRLIATGDTVIRGPVYLGYEYDSAKPRVIVNTGKSLTFNGDVYVNHSPVWGQPKSKVVFNGKISKSPFGTSANILFDTDNHNASSSDYPTYIFSASSSANITSLYAFYSKVVFESKNLSISQMAPGNYTVINCGADYVFANSNTTFNVQNANTVFAGMELNGHSQDLGACYVDALQYAPFYIRNSNLSSVPKVRVWQWVENRTNALYVEGPMHFIKSGHNTLGITNELFRVGGTLEVELGVLQILRDGPVADRIVVGKNGILDLGGKRVSCGSFELDGGIIRNGTLCADSVDIKSGGVLAEIAGGTKIVKSGDGQMTTAYPAAAGGMVSKEGLVFCYKYDSDDALLKDSGINGYDLEIYPAKDKEVGATCDVSTKKFGAGALALTGTSYLRAPNNGWFEKIPVGSAPFTVATHFKILDDTKTRMGLLGYGLNKEYNAANNRMFRNLNSIHMYRYNSDVDVYRDDKGSFSDGKWHSLVETWDGTQVRIYLDGRETLPNFLGTRTKFTAPDFKVGVLHIGNGLNQSDNESFRGWIDETALWSRALSQEEVFAYHLNGVTDAPAVATAAFTAGEAFVVDADFLDGLTDGIVCNYRFEPGENFLKDSGPNGYHLVITNQNATVTYDASKPKPTSISESAHGSGAVSFSEGHMLGTKEYPAKLPLGDKPYTVGFYFKALNTAWRGLLTYGKNVKSQCNSFSVSFANNYIVLQNYWFYNDATFNKLGEPTAVNLNKWHSFVTTWDGNCARYWFDGVEVINDAGRKPVPDLKPNVVAGIFRIGNGQNNATFKGWMDDVTIWDRAISEDEAVYFGKYGLPESYAALPKNAVLSIGENAVVKPASGKLTVGGALTLGGKIDGDVDLEDGVVLKGDAAAEVSGKVTVKGKGTFVTPSELTKKGNVWTLFTADGYAGTDLLSGWTVDGDNLKPHGSAFGVEGERMWARAWIKGTVIVLR